MKRQAQHLFLRVVTLLFTIGSSARSAQRAPARQQVKTLCLGLVFESQRKPIEKHFQEFVSYVAEDFLLTLMSKEPWWLFHVTQAPEGRGSRISKHSLYAERKRYKGI